MGILSRHIQKVRINACLPFVRGDVLDLGCGDSRILTLAGQRIEKYCGVESDPQLLKSLRQRFPQHTYLALDLERDTFTFETTFDTVLMIALIEHIHNADHLIEQALSRLKPAGRLIITTPTPLGDKVHTIGACLGLFAKSAIEHHVKIYSRSDFETLARRFDLGTEEYRSFEFGCNQLLVLTQGGGTRN
jgi:SAM-dependent methyltransferase